MNRAKKVISVGVAIPCVTLMIGQANDDLGVATQLIAAVVLIGIMAWNGFFKREEVK